MKKVSKKDKSPRFSDPDLRGATRAERKELGKAARQIAPLTSHAKLHIPRTGRDIIAVLEKSNMGRVKELVPLRYGLFLAN